MNNPLKRLPPRSIRCLLLLLPAILLLAAGCGKDPGPVPGAVGGEMPVAGFYVLNEGDMTPLSSTLGYYDYAAGFYFNNLPLHYSGETMMGLGEGGNDLQSYGSRLYAVLGGSGRVDVLDLETARHVGTVRIPKGRYIVFQDRYAYVSSYGESEPMGDNNPRGYVAKIDTASLQIVATCEVGYQPEEMVITGGKLYVANSGIHQVPDYDHTVSVIDLASFQVSHSIDVALNLHRMELDAYGNIWVSSRGDAYDVPSMVFVIDPESDCVTECLDLLPCSDMTVCGDSLYVVNNTWNAFRQAFDVGYALVDVKTRRIVARELVKDGTASAMIKNPAGIAVNPRTHEFCVADACIGEPRGKVYLYSAEGRLQWRSETGPGSARIVFTHRPLALP